MKEMHRQRANKKDKKKDAPFENLFLGFVPQNGKRGCRVIVSRLSMIT